RSTRPRPRNCACKAPFGVAMSGPPNAPISFAGPTKRPRDERTEAILEAVLALLRGCVAVPDHHRDLHHRRDRGVVRGRPGALPPTRRVALSTIRQTPVKDDGARSRGTT